MRRNVLLIGSHDAPRADALPSVGALRAEGLLNALSAEGHQVSIALPRGDDAAEESGAVSWFRPAELDRLTTARSPDVIIVLDWRLLSYLEDTRTPLVLDLSSMDPFEDVARDGVASGAPDLARRLRAPTRADLFLTASPRQRAMALSYTLAAGVHPRRAEVVVTPPIALQAPEDRKPPRALALLHAGQWLPWEDQRRWLEDIARCVGETRRATLTLAHGPPGARFSAQEREALLDLQSGLSSLDRVEQARDFPAGWRAYLQSDVSVFLDLFPRNCARELAPNPLAVEALAHGVPVITPAWGELAHDLTDSGAGWAVDLSDRGAVRVLIHELAENPAMVRAASEVAGNLVRRNFPVNGASALLSFVAEPRNHREKAARVPPLLENQERLAQETARAREEAGALREQLAAAVREMREKEDEWRFTRLSYLEKKRELMDMCEAERRRAETRIKDAERRFDELEKERARISDEREALERLRLETIEAAARAARAQPVQVIAAPAPVAPAASAVTAPIPSTADPVASPTTAAPGPRESVPDPAAAPAIRETLFGGEEQARLLAELDQERRLRQGAEEHRDRVSAELEALRAEIAREIDQLEQDIAEKEEYVAGLRVRAEQGGSEVAHWREEAEYWSGVVRGMRAGRWFKRAKRLQRWWTRLFRQRPALFGLALSHTWARVVWSVRGRIFGSPPPRSGHAPPPTPTPEETGTLVDFDEIRRKTAADP